MAYSVTTLINDLIGVTHGTTVYKIPNLYGLINRAARQVLLDVDPKETQRIVTLAPVFSSVYDYVLPGDVKGDRIIDLRKQAGREPGDNFNQTYEETFDTDKLLNLNNRIYTQWNTGVKTIRIEAASLTAPVTFTDTSSITGWAATTGASTITLDQVNNVAGGGALVFNLLAGSPTGFIETSTLTPVDLTSYSRQSYGFAWVYLPTGASITSITVRWGTDSSNYFTSTVTQNQQGIAFQNGWNLIALNWLTATQTGTPTLTNMKYTRVTFAYNSTLQTGVKFCNMTFNLGFYMELVYYSKYMFRDPTTNAFQETVADATDNAKLINLDTESYNLFFNKCAYFVAQQLQGADAAYDAIFWDSEYQACLVKYKAQNPSEAKMKAETYYAIPKKGYGRYYGNRFRP